jgi:long-chain fatty acid transport protein
MKKPSMKNLSAQLLAIAIAAGWSIGTARAGGLSLYEVGSPDVGLAAAGYAARAQDASTLLTNPAGMTRLQDSEFLFGGQML